MPRIPRKYLEQHTITVEPYFGDAGRGPTYGPAAEVKCFLDQKTRLVRDATGRQVTSSSTAYCVLDTTAPVESRVTLPDGRKTFVIAALRRDGGRLPTPNHLEVQLQ